jgi:hypothetical protein
VTLPPDPEALRAEHAASDRDGTPWCRSCHWPWPCTIAALLHHIEEGDRQLAEVWSIVDDPAFSYAETWRRLDRLRPLPAPVAPHGDDRWVTQPTPEQMLAVADFFDRCDEADRASADPHYPEHAWVWADGNYFDAVVIHREWVKYQQAAMRQDPDYAAPVAPPEETP